MNCRSYSLQKLIIPSQETESHGCCQRIDLTEEVSHCLCNSWAPSNPRARLQGLIEDSHIPQANKLLKCALLLSKCFIRFQQLIALSFLLEGGTIAKPLGKGFGAP